MRVRRGLRDVHGARRGIKTKGCELMVMGRPKVAEPRGVKITIRFTNRELSDLLRASEHLKKPVSCLIRKAVKKFLTDKK
jgi:hypothetical protein